MVLYSLAKSRNSTRIEAGSQFRVLREPPHRGNIPNCFRLFEKGLPMSRPAPDPQRTRKVLWLANLTAIMFFGALILFLPGMVQLGDMSDVRLPVLVLAILSIPAAFLARRLTGLDKPRDPLAAGKPDNAEQALARFTLAGTLAELPAILGLVYALMGGDGFYSLSFAAAALLATLALKPE
jgi:hypothetical protein